MVVHSDAVMVARTAVVKAVLTEHNWVEKMVEPSVVQKAVQTEQRLAGHWAHQRAEMSDALWAVHSAVLMECGSAVQMVEQKDGHLVGCWAVCLAVRKDRWKVGLSDQLLVAHWVVLTAEHSDERRAAQKA